MSNSSRAGLKPFHPLSILSAPFYVALVVLPTAVWAEGYLNDAITTRRLGGVGNYLFRGPGASSNSLGGDAESGGGAHEPRPLVEMISFSRSATARKTASVPGLDRFEDSRFEDSEDDADPDPVGTFPKDLRGESYF